MKNYKKRLKKIALKLPLPDDPAVKELVDLINEVLEENERLRDENAILKKQPRKPKITPSDLEKKKTRTAEQKRVSTKCSKNQNLAIDRTEKLRIPSDKIPQGAIFKGHKEYIVQELIIKTEVTRYLIEQWQLPDGTYIFAKLPPGVDGHHFGPTLRKEIISQCHIGRVPQKRVKEQLENQGIVISTGQINNILEKAAKELQHEKDALLDAGLKSSYIQADDTGARHQGKNGVATIICNDFFTFIKSTNSKSRINFLEILCGNKIEYTITSESIDYISQYKQTELTMGKLQMLLGKGPMNSEEWQCFLNDNLFGKNTCKVLTEGALIGTLLASERLTLDIILMSDGAGQFDLFKHILCWIHLERLIKKLVPINEKDRFEQDMILTNFWDFYRNLKAYKNAPTEEQKRLLLARFDTIFSFKADAPQLAHVLKKIRDKKTHLLRVLDHVNIPLHNNASENDIREYVIRRKISGGTRSDAGRDARDTFTSLYKTCKKLDVKFWQFLDDRLNKTNQIPPLAELVQRKIANAARGP